MLQGTISSTTSMMRAAAVTQPTASEKGKAAAVAAAEAKDPMERGMAIVQGALTVEQQQQRTLLCL